MMKDKVAETYSKLAGLIAGLIEVPIDYTLMIVVGDNNKVAVHEVKDIMVNVRNSQMVFFTKHMESYTKVTNALQTWGLTGIMEEWLAQRLTEKDDELEIYRMARSVLQAQIEQLEHESSRWREEAARLQELMDELAEKHYSEDSHGDS
jgi:hypothetical protein